MIHNAQPILKLHGKSMPSMLCLPLRSAIVMCQRLCAIKGQDDLTAVVLKSAGQVGLNLTEM